MALTHHDPTGYAPAEPLQQAPTLPYPQDTVAVFAAPEGVQLDAYDRRIIDWLSGLDNDTIRTVVSLIWRARHAAILDTYAEIINTSADQTG